MFLHRKLIIMQNVLYLRPPVYPQHLRHNQAALQHQLNTAIVYGNEYEMGMLVDRALSVGAYFDLRGDYANHPLVLAVRENKPWAVSILMARGVTLPDAPADGTDLLMEACKAGHAEMARVLLTVAGFSVAEKNTQGVMALHFAIISGAPDTVQVLIEAATDINAEIKAGNLEHHVDEFQENRNFVHDDQVTPLMLAAALGKDSIVGQLLAAGADPSAGSCSPLVIATKKGHAATVKVLLEAGCDPNACFDENEYEGLQALIFPNSTIECLRLLMTRIHLQETYSEQYSPLRDAIASQLPQVLALLLGSHEMNDDVSKRLEDCWAVADSEENTSVELLDFMTTAVAQAKLSDEPEAFSQLLDQILENCIKDSKLAHLGIFPSLLAPLNEELIKLRDDNTLDRSQSRLQTAVLLARRLPEIPEPKTPLLEPLPPDLAWKYKTEYARYEQVRQLRTESQALIDRFSSGLRHALDIDFFLKHQAEQAGNIDIISTTIESDLIEQTGAPADLIRIIRDSWIKSARWADEWNIAQNSGDDYKRFILHTSHNLIRCKLQDFHSELEVGTHCAEVLKKTLSESSVPLSRFCADPATWLRTLEHRNHLRPVDAAVLAIRLRIELGLPLNIARSIADAWHLAIEVSRYGGGWATTAQLHQTIERSLAGTISEVMESDEAHTIVPASDRTMITAWCDIKRRHPPPARPPSTEVIGSGSSPDGARGRKRLADNQPDHLPPGKKHRLEHSVDDESSD